ncbi:MAG: zinc dependent phospholipase C family protein [Lachnospiraceae bacterium]|nr:zinc dependent phospholipase C family protein [Lachnospiraceae bacterium]MDD3796648.1 zinc dependent phospholipase C family protein [Lachnospiraceae bacterium]
MRKKSHISLAKYLVSSMNAGELDKHRKAFYLGSILPDCKPSFLTKKHEFEGTYDKLQDNIRALTVDCDMDCNERVYWRRTGEVIHYLADYFTFPHNDTYTGTLREHCMYEKYLKNYLKYYIFSGKAEENKEKFRHFTTLDELFDYIERRHEKYMGKERNVEDDSRYITCLCLQVASGIYQLKVQAVDEQIIRAAQSAEPNQTAAPQVA